jgi:hypothetical protein
MFTLWLVETSGFRWTILARDRKDAERQAMMYNADIVREVK